MAFSSSKVEERSPVKLYTGGCKFVVKGINPNSAELGSFYGSSIDKDQVYIGQDQQGNPQIRVTFLIESEEHGIKTTLSYFVTKINQPSSTGKFKVINKYGEDSWLTEEEINAKQDVYDIGGKGTYFFNGEGLRKAYQGEPELVGFLRTVLGVKSLKAAIEEGDKNLAAGYIENMDKLFLGDVSELKGYLSENVNQVGLMLGVKSSEEGKTYQYVYGAKSVIAWSNNYDYVIKDIQSRIDRGGLLNVDFGSFTSYPVEFVPDAAPKSGSSEEFASTAEEPAF